MVEAHQHDGVDNPEVLFQDLDKSDVKQAALTAKNTDTATSSDADIVDNNRTRIEEIETALQNLGLLS